MLNPSEADDHLVSHEMKGEPRRGYLWKFSHPFLPLNSFCIRKENVLPSLIVTVCTLLKQELCRHLHQLRFPALGIKRACHILILKQQGMRDPSCRARQITRSLVSYVCQSPVNVAIW